MTDWRDQPSVVGRGERRCAICQRVIADDEEVAWLTGWGNVHAECAEAEEDEP